MPVIGIYGGSFDPPHVAHVLAAAYALSVGRFDRLLVVPVFQHAFHKRLAPFEHRARMCELAFADLQRVTVSRVEALLPVPSRTLQTVRALHDEEPSAELRLVVGSDVLGEVNKWHAFEEIRRLAPLFVVARQGHPSSVERHAACALPAVSSTEVRTLLAARSEPDSGRALQEIVPAAVLEYLERYSLYAEGLSRQDSPTE
jgi:nicotinate-nucleotide adenylyltransferase